MADYIDKESLLHKIGQIPIAWEYGQAVKDIYEMIKNAPTADVAPVVHGRWDVKELWICNSDGKPVSVIGKVYVCNRCGREEEQMEPYCNCGAKMDGTEENG